MNQNSIDLNAVVDQLSDTKNPVSRIFLGEVYPGVYLTRREAQYIYKAFQGKRREQIAQDLQISVRTLDCYIQSIKLKLGCRTAREIMRCLHQTDFLRNSLVGFSQPGAASASLEG